MTRPKFYDFQVDVLGEITFSVRKTVTVSAVDEESARADAIDSVHSLPGDWKVDSGFDRVVDLVKGSEVWELDTDGCECVCRSENAA